MESGAQVVQEVMAGRILIVDDEPADVLLLTRLLQQAGFPLVEGVTDAREAAAVYRDWDPDIVLLDLVMPDRDGFAVLADLRASVEADDFLPVVVLTADSTPASWLLALGQGASDFIAKPFQAEEVLLRVRNLLATRVLHRRQQRYAEELNNLVAERTRDLEEDRRFLQAVLDCLEEGIVACDADGRTRFANPAAIRLGLTLAATGSLPEVMPGRLHSAEGGALPPDDDPLRRAFAGHRVVGQELRLPGPGLATRTVVADGRPIIADPGTRLGAVVALRDITDRRRVEDELREQTLHDRLTGLPNRVLFLDRLGLALGKAEREHLPVAVMLLDIDHFVDVNDAFGHEAGDAVLATLARRLLRSLRPGDTGARFGGDEYAVVCEAPAGESSARLIAERIRGELSRPVPVVGRRVTPEVSIGIVVARDSGQSPAELMQDAHAAVSQAKRHGGARHELFTHPQRQEMLERQDIEAALRHAFPGNELRLFYQPTVDLRTGQVVGAEALVRWQRPGEGLVLPLRFIPIAEQTGMIVRIGQWVLRTGCSQLAVWQAMTAPDRRFTLSVNLSAREVITPGLVELVDDVLRTTQADPHRLCLEVTETTLIHDPDHAVRVLDALRARGLRIALDDFGAGHSSVAHLERFPLAVLKVDRSFVTAMTTDRGNAEIVSTVINLGHRLGLVTVAEGVETDHQASELVAMGCEFAQGYYFSAAIPAERMAALIRQGSPGSAA